MNIFAPGVDLKISTPSLLFVCIHVCAYIIRTILEAITGCENHFCGPEWNKFQTCGRSVKTE